MSEPTVHEQYNSPTANISILSSNNVLFRIHSKNLATMSAAFQVPLDSESSEAARFDESSEVLACLFGFLYTDEAPPNLLDKKVGVIEKVGRAAHKYFVMSAVTVCQLRMVDLAKTTEASTLFHAFAYLVEFHGEDTGFGPTLDTLAFRTLDNTFYDVSKWLSGVTLAAWVLNAQTPMDGTSRSRCIPRQRSHIRLTCWPYATSLRIVTVSVERVGAEVPAADGEENRT
ncbi:hypothetical protein DL96DRAFT_774393 [Flagelloscypha sp. PMI_526]|nr:hypothetical protein DL96DRAFT_774393 [Flagelloscypha sp. PMI_526]